MNKRVLMMGAALAILVSALVVILRILDLISRQDATTTLGKILSVIVVSVVAIVLTVVVVKLGKRESAR
jgi:hypothetical protein